MNDEESKDKQKVGNLCRVKALDDLVGIFSTSTNGRNSSSSSHHESSLSNERFGTPEKSKKRRRNCTAVVVLSDSQGSM